MGSDRPAGGWAAPLSQCWSLAQACVWERILLLAQGLVGAWHHSVLSPTLHWAGRVFSGLSTFFLWEGNVLLPPAGSS